MKGLLLFGFLFVCYQSTSTPPPIRAYDFLYETSIHANLDNSFNLKFKTFNSSFHLKLDRIEHLISEDSLVHFHDDVEKKSILQIQAHPYDGVMIDDMGRNTGWARLFFYNDPSSVPAKKLEYEGVFKTDDGMYHISTIHNYRISRREGLDIDIISPYARKQHHLNSKMIVFKDAHDEDDHVPSSGFTPREMLGDTGCGYRPFFTNVTNDEDDNFGVLDMPDGFSNGIPNIARVVKSSSILAKRQDSGGCFLKAPKILKIGVAADCTYVQKNSNSAITLQHIVAIFGQASKVFEKTFNIKFNIAEVKLMGQCGALRQEAFMGWNKDCHEISFDIDDRLSEFSQWRGARPNDEIGLWHLMSRCASGPTVGIAWLGQLCTKTATQNANEKTKFVSGTGVSTAVPLEWKVIAHEMGHNFGAIHDCTASLCPAISCNIDSNPDSCQCCPCTGSCDCKGGFLMHPTDNPSSDNFSPCSINLMCKNVPSAKCLFEPALIKSTIVANSCGNGVVEEGEQCDCGANCLQNNCCDGPTCKFKPPAVCDDQNDGCCSTNCQMLDKGTVCIDSLDGCTQKSICTGVSGVCPPPILMPDLTGCAIQKSNLGDEKVTKCATGICTSRQRQCTSSITAKDQKTIGVCPDHDFECTLFCKLETGRCSSLSLPYIDGTPCGGQGVCRDGKCQGSRIVSVVANYFKTSPQIAYPIAVGSGILLVLIIVSLVRCLFCGKGGEKAQALKRTLSRRNPATYNKNNNNNTKTKKGRFEKAKKLSEGGSTLNDPSDHNDVFLAYGNSEHAEGFLHNNNNSFGGPRPVVAARPFAKSDKVYSEHSYPLQPTIVNNISDTGYQPYIDPYPMQGQQQQQKSFFPQQPMQGQQQQPYFPQPMQGGGQQYYQKPTPPLLQTQAMYAQNNIPYTLSSQSSLSSLPLPPSPPAQHQQQQQQRSYPPRQQPEVFGKWKPPADGFQYDN